MRKLATIRTVDTITPIPNADAIEVATIGGWKVVVKKGEFLAGHPCVYFEIDSFLPVQPRFEFLRERCHRSMGEYEGFRLKTIRLRGQISQGLILHLSDFPEITEISDSLPDDYTSGQVFEHLASLDLSDIIGVKKYESALPAQLAGCAKGHFPVFIQKTDQERCQNLVHEIFEENKDSLYEVSLKMDGTSFTAFYVDGEQGVCSRNLELQVNDEINYNSLVRMYMHSKLQAALYEFGVNYAIQGELQGPGIQGNREGFKSAKLFVFDIYDIDNACHLTPPARQVVLDQLWALGLDRDMVQHVPIIANNVSLADLGITNVEQLLKFAEAPSLNAAIREGLVYKRIDGKFSFKAISNQFLMKEKD